MSIRWRAREQKSDRPGTVRRRYCGGQLPDRHIVIAILSNAWSETLRADLEKIEAAIVRVLVPETSAREWPAELGSKWAGRWRGAIHTHAGTVPANIVIREDRRVFVKTGAAPEVKRWT